MAIMHIGKQPKRKWTAQKRTAIVAESSLPGVSVSDLAKKYGVHKSMIYQWRREGSSSPAYHGDKVAGGGGLAHGSFVSAGGGGFIGGGYEAHSAGCEKAVKENKAALIMDVLDGIVALVIAQREQSLADLDASALDELLMLHRKILKLKASLDILIEREEEE